MVSYDPFWGTKQCVASLPSSLIHPLWGLTSGWDTPSLWKACSMGVIIIPSYIYKTLLAQNQQHTLFGRAPGDSELGLKTSQGLHGSVLKGMQVSDIST